MLGFVARVLGSMVVVLARRLVGQRLHPQWGVRQEAIIRAMRGNARAALSESAAVARARMNQLKPPKAYRSVEIDWSEVEVDGLPGVWCSPKVDTQPGVLLYLHGGGYVFGSCESYRDFLHRIALATHRKVLAVDYRLAPEAPYPAAVDDAQRAYRWLLATGVTAEELIIAGDSSGGALALTTLLALRSDPQAMPAGALLLSPWLDLTLSGESMDNNAGYSWGNRHYLERWASEYVSSADARSQPTASPAFAEELAGLCPIHLQVGACELLRSEVEDVGQRLEEAGVELDLRVYPAAVHGFQMMPDIFPAGAAALEDLAAFVDEKLHPPTQR